MNNTDKQSPIIGFCAHSGTGKTSLLTKLIPILRDKGLKLGIIKHAHHNFDTDQPGKDSYELRKAGAKAMLVSSSRRWALINEHFDEDKEATLDELINIICRQPLDLILIEGFKHEAFPKIELHRDELAHSYLYQKDTHVIALATNGVAPKDISIPVLDINNADEIATFIMAYCQQPVKF